MPMAGHIMALLHTAAPAASKAATGSLTARQDAPNSISQAQGPYLHGAAPGRAGILTVPLEARHR